MHQIVSISNAFFCILNYICRWAKISPPLFDFLTQLDYLKSSQDLHCIEAKAFLYMVLKEFDKALLSYLDLEITTCKYLKAITTIQSVT